MRVAIVHNLKPGGARRRLVAQARHLGHELLEVTLSTASPISDHPVVVPVRLRAERAPRLARPPLRYLDLRSLVQAWGRAGRAVAEFRPDVIFANPCRMAGTPPMLRSAGAPTVAYCDEPMRALYEPGAKDRANPATRGIYGPMHAAERWLDRSSLAAAYLVGTNSSYTASRIQETYGRTARLVPCGVEPVFTPAHAIPPLHILSVGSLIPPKGHDLAIEAAGESGLGWPVVVIAPWPNPQEEARLAAVAAARRVQLDIRVGVTDEVLRDAYRSAFVTLYLAQREPFGLASLEAQACGSPVVVAAEGGLPETMLEETTGWAVARSGGPVASCLNRLADPGVRRPMVEAGPEWASRHSWARSSELLDDLLHEAAS
jgi:glycosyltransferase involved in cell wall biosynthesis